MTTFKKKVVIFNRSHIKQLHFCILSLILVACQNEKPVDKSDPVPFGEDQTKDLPFTNTIDVDTLSLFDFHYLYNGGGVGIADFDNDGIKDIFLGGNLVSSKLFKGSEILKYQDVTEQAGITTKDWINGVTIVDINNDGLKDIYLSVGGPNCEKQPCTNLLFINKTEDQSIKFEEQAANYNLNIKGYSQQAVFFDADLDGDLDFYQVQNFVDPKTKNYPKPKRYFSKNSIDRFFINELSATGQRTFIEKSEEWGLVEPGFGLGVAVNDFNKDGYPDLYVANDFISDDFFFLNMKGKGFKNVSKTVLKHTTYNSMGVDIGDLNGDNLEDIVVVDMLPFTNERQKTMLGTMNFDKLLLSIKEGYNKQYIRNTVQVSEGLNGDMPFPYLDLSAQLKMHETDWSWAPLIADFNGDGLNDLFISNGYGKNITDLDFVNYNSNLEGFGDKGKIEERLKKDISKLPTVNLPNHLFINDGKGTFQKINNFQADITNGVAYADLDNDGDLDLVLNKINEASQILVNNSKSNYLNLNLKYQKQNINGIGSIVTVVLKSGKKMTKYHNPVRSYLSTMSYELNFGIGNETVDYIEITWPNKSQTILKDFELNKAFDIEYISNEAQPSQQPLTKTIFKSFDTLGLYNKGTFARHDFSRSRLLFKSCLVNRPFLLKHFNRKTCWTNAEINTLANNKAVIENVKQTQIFDNKIVTSAVPILKDSLEIAQWLVCATEESQQHSWLYLIQEQPNNLFVVDSLKLSAGRYTVSDPIGNLHFIAKFPLAKEYPSASGALLQELKIVNNSLELTTSELNSKVQRGCITDLKIADFNSDGEKDLLIIGEWMSPEIYLFKNNRVQQKADLNFEELKGLWQGAEVFDLDDDGDQDIILANVGLNTRMSLNSNYPLQIVGNDLDGNLSIDPILSYYNYQDEKVVSYQGRDDLAKQLSGMKQKFNNYEAFSKADFGEIISGFKNNAELKEVNFLESIILKNQGEGIFSVVELPEKVQSSVINEIFIQDFNGDMHKDILLLTNNSEVETHNGSIDGLNSLVLISKGKLNYNALNSSEAGFAIGESAYGYARLDSSRFLINSEKAIYKLESY